MKKNMENLESLQSIIVAGPRVAQRPVPVGQYKCTITSTTLEQKRIVFEFEIADGKYQGRSLFVTHALTENALEHILKSAVTLGYEICIDGLKTRKDILNSIQKQIGKQNPNIYTSYELNKKADVDENGNPTGFFMVWLNGLYVDEPKTETETSRDKDVAGV